MLAVLAVICGIITAVLIVLMVQMRDVHASSADLDCRLSFKQFKSFYKLKPDCWRIHMNSLRYVPAVQGLVRAVRFRRWIDVIRYGFFVCAEAHKEDQKVRDANTLSLIQDIQRDCGMVSKYKSSNAQGFLISGRGAMGCLNLLIQNRRFPLHRWTSCYKTTI